VVFAVLLHSKAAKTLQKIDEPMRSRMKKELMELREHPEKVGKMLTRSNFWSLRVGDYRAIYEIDRDKNQVVVLFVGHRKKVYDDFSIMF